MRTLQEKYNGVLEGNFSKEQFRRDAAMQLPNIVSKFNSFEDMSTILKNRGMIAEAKTQEPKYSTAKPEDTIAPDVLDTGIKFELDKNYGTLDVTDEQYAKCKEMAIKNLAKDVLYYVKQDSVQLETPGEKMEKAKLNEETALDRAQDNAARKVQDTLGDIADTVAEKPASVAAAFRKMVLANPVKYAKMSASELEKEFEAFKLEEGQKHETPKYSEEELAQITKDQQEHDEEQLRRERGLEEASVATTLADILKNKGSLDHLKKIERLRLKLIDGPFLQKNPDWKDKAVKFINYDAREGLALIDLNGTSGFAYPKELVIDTETTNMSEDARTQLKEAVKALIKKTLES